MAAMMKWTQRSPWTLKNQRAAEPFFASQFKTDTQEQNDIKQSRYKALDVLDLNDSNKKNIAAEANTSVDYA